MSARRESEVNSTDVTAVVVKDSDHWIMEEQPKQTMDALGKVFAGGWIGTVGKKSPHLTLTVSRTLKPEGAAPSR